MKCYHFRSEWTLEQLQWRSTPHFPKLLHYWHWAIRLFNVKFRTLVGGGGLTPLQRCSQCILQPQLLGLSVFGKYHIGNVFFLFDSISFSSQYKVQGRVKSFAIFWYILICSLSHDWNSSSHSTLLWLVVGGLLTPCALLHAVCDLKAA